MSKFGRRKQSRPSGVAAAQTITPSEVRGLEIGYPTGFYTVQLDKDLTLDDETAIITAGLDCLLLSYSSFLISDKGLKTTKEAARRVKTVLTELGLVETTNVIRVIANKVILTDMPNGGCILRPDIEIVSGLVNENGSFTSCHHLLTSIRTKNPKLTEEQAMAFMAIGRFVPSNVENHRKIGTWKSPEAIGGPVISAPDPCGGGLTGFHYCGCGPAGSDLCWEEM